MSAAQRFFLLAVLFEASLGAAACLAGWALQRPPWSTLHVSAAAAAWGVVATLPLAIGLVLCYRSTWGPLVRLAAFVEAELVPLFAGWRWWQLLLLSALAGWGEELLFRGLLQSLFTRGLGTVGGLLVASLLFGVVHWLTPTYALLAALMGLYLGGLWLASGNLLAPIVTHALYDAVALGYLTRRGANRPVLP